MKKIFSALLAAMLIMSTFSFSAFNAFAAGGEIVMQASELQGVLQSLGVKAAAKVTLVSGDDAPDGITAAKFNADTCEDRDPIYGSECAVVVENYPTGKGITPATYKYARMTYKYVPAEDDTQSYTPHIEFKTTATSFKSYKGTPLEENKWAYITFNISGTNYTADEVINQFRLYAFGNAVGTLTYRDGTLDANNTVIVDPDSSLYIANIAFFTEEPSEPKITGISFSSNTATVIRGNSIVLPAVTVEGTGSPITSYDLVLSGHTNAGTKISADGKSLIVDKEEESDKITLTATSVIDSTISATLTINVENPKPRSKFDDKNVVLSFGVVSDVHFSGSWNQPRSKAKGSHVVDVFQKLGADAILYNGDLTDAINSGGNVNGDGLHTSKSNYGTKGEQNFREVGYFAQSLWGADEGGFGNGVNDTTKIFYSLGNHDEGGKGVSTSSKSGITYTKVYSAEYFAAVICGWQYDPGSAAAQAVADGMEDSYRSYIADLIDYNRNSATTVTASAFESKYGVTLASADAKYDKYFGHDSEYSFTEYGLSYGNRHMTLDLDGVKDNDYTDDIHFIAMELSQSDNSIKWAEEIIKKSISENPNKPIFVISHYKTSGTTVIGSTTTTGLANLLCKYPQTFQWGGHNHSFLHSDRAIDTSNGYVATDSAVTAYASMYNLTNSNMFGLNSGTEKYAQNAATKENHAYGNGAFVEVDKNFNVRINRVDLYRSFSADYAENTSLFSSAEFTDFANKASFQPTDEAVFIRTPWDLTDIGPEGLHLQDYTKARFELSDVPSFPNADSLKVEEGKIGVIPVKMTLNAVDPDGMVYMYLLELCDAKGEVLQRYYYTNKFYDYPDANIPVITLEHSFAGISPNTTYKVKLTPVDDLMNPGVALTQEITTVDGDTKITLEDGKIAVLVDTTGENATYKWTDGRTYAVYGTFDDAASANADIVYIIKGEGKLYFKEDDGTYTNQFNNFKDNTKFIGLDRDSCFIKYSNSFTLSKNMWFENVSINKTKSDDSGLTLQGKTLTLVNVKASANPLNIFNTGWGKTDPSGTLVIKGDTGLVGNIFPGPNFGDNTGSKGDVNIILEGGTYTSVGSAKARPNNKIDGNVYITVTGGTYDNIKASHTSADHKITKNAVLKLLGGNFTTVGIAGTTNVLGKDVIVMTEAVKASITTLNKAENQIIVTVPDNASDAVGDATFDSNGYITAFAVKQIDGKKSYVNGEAATTFAVENGKEYAITYKTPNTIDFDLNGGEGDVPASITGNAGDDVTSQMPDGTGVGKANHSFLGWSYNKDALAPDTSFVISADGTTVYAVWKAKEKVKITLNAGEGTVSTATVEAFCDVETELPMAYKPYAVFAGWAESADATEGKYDVTVPSGTSDITLYAVYVDVYCDLIYVDVNAETNGDGRTSRTPMNDWKAAMEAGDEDGTIYVFMSSAVVSERATVGIGFESAKGALILTNEDPITLERYDAAAILKTNGHYSTKDVSWDIPIASYDHTGMHMNACGNQVTFGAYATFIPKGEIIPGTDLVCSSVPYLRGGRDGVNGETSVNLEQTGLTFENLDEVENATVYVGNQFGNKVENAYIDIYNGTVSKTFNMGSGLAGVASVNVFNYSAEAEIAIDKHESCDTVIYVLSKNAADLVKVPSGDNVYIIKVYGSGYAEMTTPGELFAYTLTDELYINNVKQETNAECIYEVGEPGTYIVSFDNLARSDVKYDLNGVDGTVPASYVAKEGDAVVLPELDIDIEGLTFIGWNTDKSATTALESLTMGNEAITLYAIFEKATYEVSFNAGIGNSVGELASVTKTYGEELTLPTDYVLYGTGLEFAGWSENPDAAADEVVTAYAGNAATTFFAIYNKIGTANVTPDISDEELAGAYFVITESTEEVEAPEFDIPGTATEIAKYDITLIDAATGAEAELTTEVSFTVELDEDLTGKAVAVYHVCDESEFADVAVDGNKVTFSASHLSTFVIYTVEVEAQYNLVGQYNLVSGVYTVSLYYNGEEANGGSFGFAYDNGVYTFDSFTYAEGFDAAIGTAHDEENATVTGTWYPTAGAYIGGDDEDTLIGTFTFTCANEDYDRDLASERFYEFKADEAIDEIFDGEYYLYAKHSTSNLAVTFAPVITMNVVDNEPITVTYVVSGKLVTTRDDGDAPVSFAKAVIATANGTKVTEFAIEDADTDMGTVEFEFECAPGVYTITVIKNGYLEEITEFTVAEGDLDIGEIAPLPGDIRGNAADEQGDGEISLADFVRVLRGFEYEELAAHVDINEDGIVNVTDLGFVKANFGLTK
ncbi:MAG: InlB B-repeat-containing protein [Clostridia bacterium]|nr:InlB B-repeat-containing protein [Clostridia bacterium]